MPVGSAEMKTYENSGREQTEEENNNTHTHTQSQIKRGYQSEVAIH